MRTKRAHTEEPLLITLSSILGQMSRWVVEQHPYNSAEGVDIINGKLYLAATHDETWEEPIEGFIYKTFSSRAEIEDWMHFVLTNDKVLEDLNTPEICKTDPSVSFKILFSDRYSSTPIEYEFVDIHALLRNVAVSVWKDAEEFAKFNADFDKQWKRDAPKRVYNVIKDWFVEQIRRVFPAKLPEDFNMSREDQLSEWSRGNSIHNGKSKDVGECCPDFSCCSGKPGLTLKERQEYFDSYLINQMNKPSLWERIKDAYTGH